MDAVRRGVETAGWPLSGLQKTTSLEFEGRWEGESTRSAYLFFHRNDAGDDVSVDVYLDETSRGLTGNLALVVDLASLGEIGDPAEVLAELGRLSKRRMPAGSTAPVTLRLRLPDGAKEPATAEVEIRFKLNLASRIIAAGGGEIRRFAAESVAAFERILDAGELERYRAAR